MYKSNNSFANTRYIQYFIYNLLLLLLAATAFAAVFPSAFFRFGLGFLSPFCLVPLGLLLRRIRIYWVPVWGFFYGLFAYGLFNMWLVTFSPVAFLIVPVIYAFYFFVLSFLLKLAEQYFFRYGFLVQAIIWLLYEYVRTTGFLGYSFGILGYSLSFYPLLIQSADIFGVWGITFVLASISFFVAQYIGDILRNSSIKNAHGNASLKPRAETIHARMQNIAHTMARPLITTRLYTIYAIALVGVVAATLLYGVFSPKDVENLPSARIALIQHNTDPWKGGYTAYKTSLDTLIQQTEKVMHSPNPPEVVVWSETSFVPSISYHQKYREIASYTRLIQRLLDYIGKYPNTEFLIGNGEGVKIVDEDGKRRRQDYNAALFFRGKELQETYYKIHLVPFTEYFPYKKSMPNFYQFLLENDTHFWLPGTEYTVFKANNFAFSTPICFEDGFGLQNAKFVREGAEIIINITNDAWSHVENNAMQHLQLSIFRAVENRRSVARSTNAGMTAVVDINGSIAAMLPSFETGSLVYDVPIHSNYFSLYTLWGDWFILLIAVTLAVCIVLAIVALRSNPVLKNQ